MYWRTAGVALALRPMRCVFSDAELALLLLLALLLDERACVGQTVAASRDSEGLLTDKANEKETTTTTSTATMAQRPITHRLAKERLTTRAELEAALRSLTTATSTATSKATCSTKPSPASRDTLCSFCSVDGCGCDCGSCAHAGDDGSLDSCATSDTADMALLSAASAYRNRRVSRDTGASADADAEDALFDSMVHNTRVSDDWGGRRAAFTHRSGELQLRRESVYVPVACASTHVCWLALGGY